MSKRITNPLVGLYVSKNIEDLDKIRNKMNAQVQKIRRHEKLCGDIIYDVLCLNALLPYRKAQDKLQRAEDTSNLETDDEELLKKRRRCTVNYMTLYTGV